MKTLGKIIKNMLIIFAMAAASVIALSLLGHYKVWIFTSKIGDNSFVVGAFVLVLSGLSLKNHTGNGGYYSVTRMNTEYNDKNKYERFGTLFSAGLILMLISALIPTIKL